MPLSLEEDKLGFRKIRYNTGEEIFRVRIESSTGQRIEEWVIMKNDFPQWIKMICSKYGFTLEKKKTDLDWAK